MRELHVVALSEDGRHVVLATRAGAPSGEFRVALDDRLTAAVRGELPAPGRDAPPSISPRDIQARLRDGESPDEIAASAGVPLSRVERYAGPVLAELERMIAGARGATVSRPRLGPSALPLGQAVEAHLAEVAHLAEGSVRWSARRGEHGRWVVSVSWTARGRRRTAGWQYDPATREATAVDGPSAVLGHVEAATAAVPAAARVARPAAAAPTRTGRTTGAARSSSAGRGVRTAASAPPAVATPSSPAAAAASARSGAGSSASPARPGTPPTASGTAAARTATARTATSRTAAPETPPTHATPSTRAPSAASAPGRRSKAPAAATPGNTTAAATPAAATPAPARSTRRRPAAAQEPVPVRTTAKAQPRRPAARRSAVPSLDELAGATADAPATRPPAPATRTQPPGPPVLRVVPPAAPEPEPEPADDAAPPPEARPARRAAGQRAGGRDWADVLMGGGPAPPAAEPRQD